MKGQRQFETAVTGNSLNIGENWEDDPHVQLAAAVITTAYSDINSKNDHQRSLARFFFEQRQFLLQPWAEAIRRTEEEIVRGYDNVAANGMPGKMRLHRGGG